MNSLVIAAAAAVLYLVAYINAFQLCIAMVLLLGIVVTHPPMVAPTIHWHPEGAPSIFPLLFITVACGAISGFHCLVSSGTSSKQCDNESMPKANGSSSSSVPSSACSKFGWWLKA